MIFKENDIHYIEGQMCYQLFLLEAFNRKLNSNLSTFIFSISYFSFLLGGILFFYTYSNLSKMFGMPAGLLKKLNYFLSFV